MQYKLLVKKISVSADKKIKQKEYLPIGKLPIIDQGKQLIGGYSDDFSKHISCNLPVIIFGDHTKNVKLIPFQFAAGADGIKVLEPKNNISPKYLYYGTLYLTFRIEDKGYARHYQHIEKQDLPVPPLPEQERIVARIEELFSELDKSVETLKKTKAQLAVYRQAVLKEAFEEIEEKISFGEIIDSRLGKMLDKTKNIGTPRHYLRNINVRWFSFDLSDMLEMKIADDEIKKYSINKNDLVICEGGEPGRCAVWDKDYSIFYQKALHRVRFTDGSNPKFYMFYLWFSAQTGELTKYYTGTGIRHLTGQSLNKITVPKALRNIQDEIVLEIESRLSVCDNIDKTVDTALQEAEAMRQSILKQTFEGRL